MLQTSKNINMLPIAAQGAHWWSLLHKGCADGSRYPVQESNTKYKFFKRFKPFSSGNALTTWRGNLCGIDSSAANLLLPCLPLSHVWDASRVLSWSSFYRGSALWKRWSIFSHGEHVILNPSMQVVPDFAWCPHPTMQRSGLTSKRPHIAARGDILGLCKTRQTKIKNSVGFSMYWLC